MIRQLQASDTIPIERARMRIRLTMANKDGKRLKEKVTPLVDSIEDEDWTDEWELVSAAAAAAAAAAVAVANALELELGLGLPCHCFVPSKCAS